MVNLGFLTTNIVSNLLLTFIVSQSKFFSLFKNTKVGWESSRFKCNNHLQSYVTTSFSIVQFYRFVFTMQAIEKNCEMVDGIDYICLSHSHSYDHSAAIIVCLAACFFISALLPHFPENTDILSATIYYIMWWLEIIRG